MASSASIPTNLGWPVYHFLYTKADPVGLLIYQTQYMSMRYIENEITYLKVYVHVDMHRGPSQVVYPPSKKNKKNWKSWKEKRNKKKDSKMKNNETKYIMKMEILS